MIHKKIKQGFDQKSCRVCPRLRFFSRLRSRSLRCRSSSVTVPGCDGPVKPKKCLKKIILHKLQAWIFFPLNQFHEKNFVKMISRKILVPKKNTQATGLGRKSCRKGGSRIWSKGPLMGQARAFQNMVFSIIIFNLVKMNRNKDMVKWRFRSYILCKNTCWK